MSVSDSIEVVGCSESDDPVEALRDALSAVLAGLVAQGCGPAQVHTLRWEVAEPARFHPARMPIELAYREIFVAFRVPVTLVRTARRGVRVVASATRTVASSVAVYEGYTLAELGRQYSPRGQADMNAVFKQWSADGARLRAEHGGLDIAYGTDRFETFDLFVPQGVARPPVWILIHGGYWQASDKAQHAQFAAGMLAAGFAVAMPNYGLASEAPLAVSVAQMDHFVRFLSAEGANLGVDATQIHLAGHSAGGHLAAITAARARAGTIRSALLLSGLFDLAPLALLPFGPALGLTPARVADLSPIALPAPACPVALAVGAGESDAFKRQSHDLAKAWSAPGPHIVPGHHFSMLEGLNGGALLDLALALARGA